MTQIKNYNFSENELSFIISDISSGLYIWAGFKSDGSNCALQKLSANNPLQIYFDIDIAVDEIKKAFISGSYIYLAYDDSTLIGARYSLSSPLITSSDFSLPSGILEAPVDVLVNGSDLFYLIPGEISGQNAKIVKMSTSGVFDQTIDLATVSNAKSFTIDTETGDIWLITSDDPSVYVRVYEQSGGVWTYSTHSS